MMKHPLGCHRIAGRTFFTLYAPYAQKVRLLLFETCDQTEPQSILPMRSVSGGFWEYSDIKSFSGLYYAFRIDEHDDPVADPYARSVSTFNDFHQKAKAFIYESKFDWEGDRSVTPADPRDLIIYEAHVKDMSAHKSANVANPGTYAGLIDKIPYLKDLGINAVELLPIQQFANFEPPYEEAAQYVQNTWNPYAYNHWGYMTSFFFAPANFYSSAGNRVEGQWSDPRGQEIDELKSLVKALHKNGIAVIMDVVYNHISQYNLNPLRILAEQHYIDANANTSGCGNDVRSESPVMKRLITDSIRYWMEEFHMDGFRFDLAGVLEDETLSAIQRTAKSINPNVILVGEPWGRRYFPQRMSDLHYGVWNDMYRNGLKGENPYDRPGFIFGAWDQYLNRDNFGKLLTGSLRKEGGLVPESRFTVNYLTSHDGYTLGDFIRIAMRKTTKAPNGDLKEHLSLSEDETAIYKMGAFLLSCSQGIMMLHAGQEFARTKVIREEPGVSDPAVGEMDHDSYNKDNETNYINYDDINVNKEIFEYYKDLIALRKGLPELRSADRKQITNLVSADNEFGLGYLCRSSKRTVAILVNTSAFKTASFHIDEGHWNIHANGEFASLQPRGTLGGGTIGLEPRSHLLLIKNNS
jgi:pullulanase/glycogen debranching enzyme